MLNLVGGGTIRQPGRLVFHHGQAFHPCGVEVTHREINDFVQRLAGALVECDDEYDRLRRFLEGLPERPPKA